MLEILRNLDSATNELKKAMWALKGGKITPAEFLLEHFPNVGTKTHAVYAVTRVLITRDASTSATVIVKHVKELLRLQYALAKQTNSEAQEVTLSDAEIKNYIDNLIIQRKLNRTPGGTIT